MKVIYENEITAVGECVHEFDDGGMFIVFGEDAPDELKDYCYSISVNPINGTIEAGQILKIDDNEYKITAVGYEVPITLAGLGHMTIRLSGDTEPELPGTLYVEEANVPIMDVGTKILIYKP